MRNLPNVIDIRTIGLVAGIELAPRKGAPGARGYDILVKCFEAGALIRVTGDIIALSPPLIIEKDQIDRLFDLVSAAIKEVA